MKNIKIEKRIRLHRKIRSRISGTESRPRLTVFRSNEYIYAQLINDDTSVTLASANDLKIKGKTKTERAQEVGNAIAELAKKANITSVVFDRSGFKYGGRVKALADAARAAGLNF
ncbi:MAG: large subunit ribosomal protein [Patescibacteria group bacterium]|nr:large subunit ribosomal protein [Patescibacteria group bacterium]